MGFQIIGTDHLKRPQYSRNTNLPLENCNSQDSPHFCNPHCALLNDGIECTPVEVVAYWSEPKHELDPENEPEDWWLWLGQ